MHDYMFDTKEFCRKIAWSAYFENKRKEKEMEEENQENSDVREILYNKTLTKKNYLQPGDCPKN